MDILPTQKSVRIGGVFFLFIFICAFYRLGTIQPNLNYLRQFKVKPENKTPPTRNGFLVWSQKCQILDVDPFDRSIKKLLRRADPIVCSRLAPLTYTTSVAGRQVLRVDAGVVGQYNTTLGRLQCCFSVITRLSEDKNNVSRCTNFSNETVLGTQDEFLIVRCSNKKTGKQVYTNMHAVVQVKSPPIAAGSPTSSSEEGSVKTSTPQRLSVLLLGIDSMSRLNMLRTMPRTVAHLRSNKWLELRGYNKIADNTFPNLMAILTGLNREQLTHNGCWPTKKEILDNCTLIWQEFKQKGYVTAYAEDEPDMATFNYHKGGFVTPPTDYYFRPFMLAATRQLPLKKRDGHKVCLGPASTTDHFLRFTMDLATTFNNALFFAIIWLNNFSHNNHNTPAALDKRFLEFFHEIQTSGALNTTLIVFFSDHGARFGNIRKTFVGWLEERLPFLYLWVPEWFKETYPEYYSNLRDNGDRLTSPYDLHLTLKDVVVGLEHVGTVNSGSGGCPSCASLFTTIPYDRGCKDAGITPHWCTCAAQATLSVDDKVVKIATQFVINEIRTRLSEAGNVSEKCAKLRLNKIMEARLKIQNETSPLFEDYIVIFETQPGSGQFDATVRYWHKSEPPKFEVMGIISRIDSYESQSKCMKNADLKLYCICVH